MFRRTGVLLCFVFCLLTLSSLASAKAVQAAESDNIIDAVRVVAGKSYTVKAAEAATLEQGEMNHTCIVTPGQGNSVWFRYKSDRDITVTFDTNGTNLPYAAPNQAYTTDTVMSVFTLNNDTPPSEATFPALWTSGCNDDVAVGTRYSKLTVEMNSNLWYYIRVTPYKAGVPLPAGSTYKLNVRVENLVAYGSFQTNPVSFAANWTLSGQGASDDAMICDVNSACAFHFNSGAAGSSKLKQVIDSFGGLKFSPGDLLMLSATGHLEGTQQDFKMKLAVTYADGTTTRKKALVTTDATRLADTVTLSTVPMLIEKPIARIVVTLVNSAQDADSGINIDDVVLQPMTLSSEAPAALPLPPMGGAK